RLWAFLSHFFTVGVVKKNASFPTEPENFPKRDSRVKKGFQKVRRLFGSQNKNNSSLNYAQSSAEGISNRPTLPKKEF
ncbi:MAG: hypothetical protein U0N39_08475, partial [Faecalibacterium prausnitzii]